MNKQTFLQNSIVQSLQDEKDGIFSILEFGSNLERSRDEGRSNMEEVKCVLQGPRLSRHLLSIQAGGRSGKKTD